MTISGNQGALVAPWSPVVESTGSSGGVVIRGSISDAPSFVAGLERRGPRLLTAMSTPGAGLRQTAARRVEGLALAYDGSVAAGETYHVKLVVETLTKT